jgi:hypothetical protein
MMAKARALSGTKVPPAAPRYIFAFAPADEFLGQLPPVRSQTDLLDSGAGNAVGNRGSPPEAMEPVAGCVHDDRFLWLLGNWDL